MVESRMEEKALHQHIRRRTVRLLDLTDKSAGGSAVTVQLGERFFLATAAHVIPPNHEIRVLVGEADEENIGQFKARHVNEEDDVGLLELDESTAGAIDSEFTGYEQLPIHFDQSSRWCATLIGYPGMSVVSEDERDGDILRRTHSFATFSLVTNIIPFGEWPKRASFQRRPPSEESDIFVEFKPETTVYHQDWTDLDRPDTPAPEDEVRLEGMSGCGIWLDRARDDGVWRSEPSLAGIDTGVCPSQGWARGTQIAHWLALVCEHYKEFSWIRSQLKDR